MTEITIYKANDGKEFLSKDECLAHEKRQEITNAANIIQQYCDSVDSCAGCPFNGYEDCKVGYPIGDWDWTSGLMDNSGNGEL